jgi:hypothetical protein
LIPFCRLNFQSIGRACSKYDKKQLSGVTTFDRNTDKVDIIEPYHSDEELLCSCGEKQPHNDGFHVLFQSGEEGLVGGAVCGPKYFGVEWEQASQVLEEKQRHERVQRRLIPTRSRAREMQRALTSLEAYARHKDGVFGALKRELPRFFERLEDAGRKHNGRLLLGSTRSNPGAEQSSANDDFGKYFGIRGHECIATGSLGRMAAVHRDIGTILKLIENDDVKDAVFEAAEKKLEDISIDRFLPLYREGQAFEAFFDTAHLKQFFANCEEAGLLGRASLQERAAHNPGT